MANLSLIEEYARKLEQEQMDVADTTHSDPNSAEEGRRQFFENNPHMKRYRHRQAQGKAIKQGDVDWNLGSHFAHGVGRLGLRSDQASAVRDAQTYSGYAPYKDVVSDLDVETQAFADQGFPQDYLDWSPEKQYSWQLENHPQGLPSSMDDFLRRRAQTTAMFDEGDLRLDRDYVAGNLASTTQALQDYAQTAPPMDAEGANSIMGSDGIWGTTKSLFQNPKAALQITSQSLGESAHVMVPQILASLVNPALGAAAGMVGGTWLNETFGISVVLEKYGVDAENPEQVAALIDNPELLNSVINEARTYAMTHGAVDAVGGYATGKLLGIGQKAGSSTAANVGRRLAAVPAEVLSEGGGEAAALTSIGYGPSVNPNFGTEVAIEGFAGGLGAGPFTLPGIASDVIQGRGTVPPVASDGMPNLPALPQGPAPEVAPSATQDPYRTPPSFGPENQSRRDFIRNVGDIATVAATTPTDLLPNLAEAAPAAVETAAPVVAPKLSMDYLNLPMPTDYVFDINGKTVYAMTPDHIDIEQGETFVQFTDDMGGDDLPGVVSNVVDIGPYLDPVQDISQRDVDKAVARAIQDTFINEGDEFFLGDVRRYYDEAGDGAEYASPFDIQRMEAQNDPEGIFDEVMLQREARSLGTNRDDKQLGGYSRIESKPTAEPRLQKRPIVRDPTELEDSGWESPFEAQIARDAEKLAEQERIEELARDREVTEVIPRLPVLTRKLSEARDRLKSLEAGNPPPGFEDDYTQEEIEEDIRIEKDNIAALEEEERIKSEEPVDAEFEEVDDTPTVDAASVRSQYIHPKTGRPTITEPIEEGSDLYKQIIDLYKGTPGKNDGLSGWKIREKLKLPRNKVFDVIRNEKEKGDLPRPNVKYTEQEIRKHYGITEKDWESLTKEEKVAKRRSYGSYVTHKARGWVRPKDVKQYLDPGATVEELKAIDRVFKARNILKDYLGVEDLVIEVDHSKQKSRQSLGEYLHNANNLQLLTQTAHRVKNRLDRSARNSLATEEEIRKSEEAFSRSNPFSRHGGKGEKSWWDEIVDRHDANDGSLEEYFESLDLDRWLNNEDAADAAITGPRVDAEIDPNAKRINKTKKVKGRTYRFYGAEHLPGVDINRIINKVDLKGRGKDVIDVAFLYVPATGRPAIEDVADSFVQGLGTVFGRAQGQANGRYKIAINLARFDEDGITEVLVTQADRLGISVEELMKRVGNENLQEYAIRTTLQHEITHVNHFIWENALLGESGSPSFANSKRIQKWRRDLYKTYRQELLDFMKKDDKAYHRIGLGMEVDSNQEAITFLDNLMREASKPTAPSGTRYDASRKMWSVFSELLAYQSDSKNIETWTTKFKRVVKMLLAKVGINIGKDDLNDLMDDLYSTGNIRQNLKPVRVLKEGPILSEEAKTEEAAREVKARMEGRDLEVGTPINPSKFYSTNDILRKNNVSEKVISDISKTLSIEEKELPLVDIVSTLESVFGLDYDLKDLTGRLSNLAETDKDEYSKLAAMVETSDRLYNLDMDLYEGREDINTGNAISDLETEITKILGPVNIEEQLEPDFDEDSWVQAWSEPKGSKKKRNYNEQFNATMDRQAGNTETPGYTSPLNQELDRTDDAAQREYTDSDSVSRPKARERTMLRNLFQHLYSRAAQTVRRHSGASKTTGLIADMILRAPHVKQREKETKAGRDYVQKKSMAMGEFRLEAQRALDELTNRGGVIPRKVNDQLRDYFLNGTMPQNGRVAAAVSQLESAIERIYAWSEKVGTKYTEDFSLRPVDGGKLPRVYDTDKVASPDGRRKLMDLLESIGIVNDPTNNKYDATDVYNIILNSGGFVSGDFTESARNIGIDGMQTQRELFDRIEREIPRDQLGDLLLTDYQAIIPRFVDKAIEKTVYAEMFGHKNEHLLELKQKVREEVEDHNRKSDTFIDPDYVMKSIDEMMDIIHHRYKVNTIPTRGRKIIQAAMNATTMAGLTLVSLASMPEFFTMTALGSKNPAKFATNVMGAATYSALKGLNGMNKLLTGRVMKGYFDPKTKVGKRAKFLRELGLYDISSLGEAAAQRYVGPSFIKAGVGSTGNSFAIRALYRLYGLGNLEKGRFRARQGRALMNMDTYFEINMLTTMTQMQQMMALKNLEQNIVSDAKALSKAAKGKGMKLDSTIAQIKSNLKGYGLSDSEINELVRWYDAGHRELYDVPGEFKLDLAGPAHRFVQAVITLPSEGSLPKVFRNPAFAPFLLFKSFITTFGNTFVNTVAQRLRFAEGTGVSKKYQQGKQLAGMMGTAAAMYGAVQFAQAVGYLIKYGEDDDPWEEKIGDFNKFMQDFERTGLLGPLGSLVVQTATPNYWSWAGKDPYDDLMDYVVGPVGRQASNIMKTGYAAATGGDVDPEGRLAKAVPLTKSTPLREALGAKPYYTKDKKGGMIRRRTLERREEKKAAKAAEKKQTILDSIPNEASKALGLSKTYIVRMSKKELDKHIKKKTGIDVDGRKSKIRMLEEMMEKKQ